MTKIILTPIFIFLVLGLVISVPITFYYLFIESSGGMALVGAVAGIYSIMTVILLIIERLIVNQTKASRKNIWIVEIVLLVALLLAYLLFFV